MARGWLTPDTLPAGFRTCEISFPDSEDWHSLVRGALFLLTQAENFEEFGSVTAQETADTFLLMLEKFFGDECMQIPVGVVMEYAGSVLPAGYLWADGAAVSRTLYADLFDAIGVEFGVGNGTTTFNVPDRRGKVGVGLDPTDSDLDILGATYGTKNHTLAIGEIPSHSHTVFADASMGAGATARRVIGISGASNVSTGSAGGGGSHNNMQPSLVFNYIIRF